MSVKHRRNQKNKRRNSQQQSSFSRIALPLIITAVVVAAIATWWILSNRSDATPSGTSASMNLTFEVPNPDLSHVHPLVAKVLRDAREDLLRQTTSAEAWGELGRLYDAHEFHSEAETCYRHATTLSPSHPGWAYLYAHIRDSRHGDADEIIELFQRMMSLAEYPPAAFRLGDALSRRGRNEEARDAFAEAIRMDPTFGMAHRSLGQTLLALNDLQGAQRHLEQAQSLLGQDGITEAALAQLFNRLGDQARAEQAFRNSRNFPHIAAVPDPFRFQVQNMSVAPQPLNSRISRLMAENKLDEAVELLQFILGVTPNDLSALYRLGLCYEQMGRVNDAVASYRRIIRIEPGHVAAERLSQLTGG